MNLIATVFPVKTFFGVPLGIPFSSVPAPRLTPERGEWRR